MHKHFFDMMRQFAALVPPRLLTFPSCLPWNEVHDFFLHSILMNPHFKKYPPPRDYQHSFWRWCINYLENIVVDRREDDEIDVRIYDHYLSLLSPSAPSSASDPPPSYVTHIWTTETPMDNQDHVDLSRWRMSTLHESRNLIEKGTTGLRTWPASLVLAQYLISQPDIIEQSRVLELGSGTGLLGIIVGTLQRLSNSERSGVWMSDANEEVLARCRENIELPCNDLSGRTDSVHCCMIDWSAALCAETCTPLQHLLHEIDADVVLGADVVFDPDILPALVQTIYLALNQDDEEICPPKKTAFIALIVRREDTYSQFMRLAERVFVVRECLQSFRNPTFIFLPEGRESVDDTMQRVKIIQLHKKNCL